MNNEAQTPVYYDNLVAMQSTGNVIEVNAYYPYGKIIQGLSTSSTYGKNNYKYNGKELQTELELGWLDYGARPLPTSHPVWFVPDPLAEKYYNISPYAYALNNPINFIDPFGLDVYRYDDETGKMILFQKTDDDFDQIGKFKYDKKTDAYTLKTNRKGETKTRIDNIEKGILSDGVNFKENSYIFEVGGEGQPTEQGFERFALQLSDMVGKEIGGAYFSKDGAEKTTHMSIGMYKYNSYTETKSSGHGLWNRMYPDSKIDNSITGFFHTHPSGGTIGAPDNRTKAHEQDLKSKANALKQNPTLQFFILTNPVYYGGKIKFPY